MLLLLVSAGASLPVVAADAAGLFVRPSMPAWSVCMAGCQIDNILASVLCAPSNTLHMSKVMCVHYVSCVVWVKGSMCVHARKLCFIGFHKYVCTYR